MCAEAQQAKKAKPAKELRKSENVRLVACHVNDTNDVELLYLSPLTQVFLGCRIGQEVTVITPWIFIEKEKILDHIEFYGKESEFFEIQDKVMQYPQDKMMIGCCNYNANIPVDFYICTTVKAQQTIESVIKTKDEVILQKIYNSIYPKVGHWESLGSEEQITNEMILNHRMLLAVDVVSNYPLHKVKPHFHISLAEEILNGYAELRAERPIQMHFLLRKRIDSGAQAAPLKLNQSVQTQAQGSFQQNIQYSYKCPTFELTEALIKELEDFLQKSSKPLCDLLLVNYYLNLYKNDYSSLQKHSRPVLNQKVVDIKLYQDIYCKRTKVSCMSWNAIISGVVAAAYSRNPILCLSKRLHLETVKDPATENHLILIWYYNDNVRPKLYLHAKSEVTALSFCPYDENILVAGYSNGRIAVWDLTDRLVESETRTFLTEREQQYHSLMADLTNWIKRPLGFNHIFPVLTSELQFGDTSPVTSIAWLPPSHYISEMRRYEECEAQETHMQFLTISLDGNKIFVWDLKPTINETTKSKRTSKKSRLAAIPEALAKNVSPLQQLQEYFKPVCKIFVNAPASHKNQNPLIKMVMKNEMYSYTAVNSNTLDDMDAFTYFDVGGLAFEFDMAQKLIFTTGLGVLQIASWEGANYKGEANQEVCKMDTFPVVHDGPILVCEINTYFPDMILTVGGSVFAIWDCSKTRDPLVWRKGKHRYLSGMWCLNHPLSILVIRIDRCYEFWNVSERSDDPIELDKYKGYDLIKFYGASTRCHSRKKTFITADALGAFKLFSLPTDVASKSSENYVKAMEYIKRVYEMKQFIEVLKEKCRQKMQMNVDEAPEPKIQEPVLETPTVVEKTEKEVVSKSVKISRKVRFETNLEEHMQAEAIKRKKLDTIQIKRDKLMCLQVEANKRFKNKHLHGEEIMAAAKEDLLGSSSIKRNRRRLMVTVTKEKASDLKRMYMESFREIEHEIVKIIKSKKNRFKATDCRNLRSKYENISHLEMKHLKRKIILESEVDMLNMRNMSIVSVL